MFSGVGEGSMMVVVIGRRGGVLVRNKVCKDIVHDLIC
jgi:hypothetical protein